MKKLCNNVNVFSLTMTLVIVFCSCNCIYQLFHESARKWKFVHPCPAALTSRNYTNVIFSNNSPATSAAKLADSQMLRFIITDSGTGLHILSFKHSTNQAWLVCSSITHLFIVVLLFVVELALFSTFRSSDWLGTFMCTPAHYMLWSQSVSNLLLMEWP